MTAYDLTDTSCVAGTIHVKLYSATAGLTVPTYNTILTVGAIKQSASDSECWATMGTLELSVRDEYGTYDEGFWFKVLQGETWIRLYLDESGTDTLLFFGIVDPLTVEWEEHYVSGTNRVRHATFQLVTMDFKLQDVLTSTWLTDAYAERQASGIETPTNFYTYLEITRFLTLLLTSSGLNAAPYDVDEVTFVYGTQDIKYYLGGTGGTLLTPDELLIVASTHDGEDESPSLFFDSGDAKYLGNDFEYASELLSAIAFGMGFLVNLTYDTDDDRWKLQLIQRMRAYAGTVSFGSTEIASVIRTKTPVTFDAIKVTNYFDGLYAWRSRKWIGEGETDYKTSAVPDHIDIDADRTIVFMAGGGALEGSPDIWYGTAGDPDAAETVDTIEYYDHLNGAYVDIDTENTTAGFQIGLAGYYFYQLAKDRQEITRTYGKIKADAGSGDTQTAVGVMRRAAIDDNVSEEDYFANEIEKNVAENTTTVVWIQE